MARRSPGASSVTSRSDVSVHGSFWYLDTDVSGALISRQLVLINSISMTATRMLTLLLVILFSTNAFAVDPNKGITQYAHAAWRTHDGFFNGTPRSITQTTDGYIWIATQNDLFQFDGVRLIKWTPPPETELPSSRINALLGSSDG